MLRTLRRRLVLSHVLPLMVISPLMGLALVYILETQVLLTNLSGEMKAEAFLVAQLAGNRHGLWDSPPTAQQLVAQIAPNMAARVMLLDPGGHLLASSDPTDASRVGQQLDIPPLPRGSTGSVTTRTAYSRDQQAEVADVLVPVQDGEGHLLGIVRLTHRLSTVYEWFLRLRYLIAGVLTAGVLLGAGLGWALALNLSRPLGQVTRAVGRLAGGQQPVPIPEQGPEEILLLARAFNTLLERLQTLEKTRRQLLANLVHELARPMGALLSALQALQRGAGEDTALRQELLAGMQEEVVRLQRLVDNLAQLRDRILEPPSLVRQEVDLREWLRRTLAPWREAAHGKGLDWQLTLPDQLPEAEVDPDRLAQAVGNLLSNAIKYTPSGGTVSITAGFDQGSAWIRVSDTGPGIPPREQSRIFTPFFRGSQAGRFPQGMGLGLAIARDLVLAHEGELQLENTGRDGAQFLLRFPLKPQ